MTSCMAFMGEKSLQSLFMILDMTTNDKVMIKRIYYIICVGVIGNLLNQAKF